MKEVEHPTTAECPRHGRQSVGRPTNHSGMKENPLLSVGRPDELEGTLALSWQAARQIGAIVVFAGNVEFRLERAIWRLQGHVPRGVRHATDAKPIGELINMFEAEGSTLPSGQEREVVELWCATARMAFKLRHSIAHGAAFRFEADMIFHRNRSWQSEIRKRPAHSLWGDQDSLDNIRLVFAVLLRVINAVSNDRRPFHTVASPERLEALCSAKSLMREMAVGDGPWFEKS